MARIVACTLQIPILFQSPFLEPIDASGLFGGTCEATCNRSGRLAVRELDVHCRARPSEKGRCRDRTVRL
jgi:hypothetical protein